MKQRIKNIISWIIILIVILVAGFFYGFVYRREVISYASFNIEAYNGNDILCEIECTQDRFIGMEIAFAENDNPKGEVTYVLSDYKNEVLFEKSIKVESLKDDDFTLFKTDIIEKSNGHKYTFLISCDNEPEDLIRVLENSEVRCVYIDWDLETMIVFCLGSLYLVALAKVLIWMFRK